MLRNILLILVVIVAGVLGYAATRPDSFRIERSITINAPAERIFPLIDDFRGWTAWSPWEKRDPAMKKTYGGPPRGPGAVYEWSGNSEVGSGRMEIIRSAPGSNVTVDLHFLTPFEGRNTAEFILAPEGEATSVTWAMYGPSPFVSKLMGLFMSMDAMLGGDFESGLAAMKAVAERDG